MSVRLLHYKSVPSTQDLAAGLSCQSLPWLVWANRQTRGRGRGGRDWVSAPGGLYYTLRYPIPSPSSQPSYHLMFAAYCWVKLIEEQWLSPGRVAIKWPNDVVVEGRKLAGLLADVDGRDVLLGVGLNVNNSFSGQTDKVDRPATSLADQWGESISRRRLLFDWWERFEPVTAGESPPPPSVLETRLETLGRRVRTEQGEGEAVALREDGGLVLEADGTEFVAHSSNLVEVES